MQICLTCLYHSCGRYESKHALKHYNENKNHHLAINSKTLNIWCYSCDEDLQVISDQHDDEVPETEKDQIKAFIEQAAEIFMAFYNGEAYNLEQSTDRGSTLKTTINIERESRNGVARNKRID